MRSGFGRRAGAGVRIAALMGLVLGAWVLMLPGSSASAEPTCPPADSIRTAAVSTERGGAAEPAPEQSSAPIAAQTVPADPTGAGADDETGSEPDPPADAGLDAAELSELSIAASSSPATAVQGEVVTITIEVSNAGPDADPSVLVTQAIPEGAVLEGPIPGLNPASGVLDLGSIAVGQTVTVRIPVVIPDASGGIVTMPSVVGEVSDGYSIDDQTCTVVQVVPSTGPDPAADGPAGAGPQASDEPAGDGGEPAGAGGDSDGSGAAALGPESDPEPTTGGDPPDGGPPGSDPTGGDPTGGDPTDLPGSDTSESDGSALAGAASGSQSGAEGAASEAASGASTSSGPDGGRDNAERLDGLMSADPHNVLVLGGYVLLAAGLGLLGISAQRQRRP